MKATRTLLGLTAALTLFTAACGDDDKDTSTPAATDAAQTTGAPSGETSVPATDAAPTFEGDLVGTFGIDAGDCSGATPVGSYFQMVNPGGTAEAGPFIPNSDSACADTNFTLLTPGTDGGLSTVTAQAAPDPAFDATGNGLATLIAAPVKFFGVSFAVATDGAASVTASGGTLTGNLAGFTAYYGTGIFNQGAPKPDGSGTAATGTIDPATGHYTLTWTSLISGGSFDGFTGVWHLEGTFTPKA